MESTHGKLCTGLSDGLSRDNTYCLTDLNRLAGSHVCPVTFGTDPNMGTAGKDGTDLHLLHRRSVLVYAYA